MNKNELLNSVTVLDTETTHLLPEKAEIVELASARYSEGNWKINTLLMGANSPIPPEASAKNHISNRMISGLPRFQDKLSEIDLMLNLENCSYLIAHNSKYDQKVLETTWTNLQQSRKALIAKTNDKWLCTHRLSKKLLDFDFNDMQYNLSFLRYKLDLPVPDEMGAHRAGADTLTCALLFEFLIEYAIETDKINPNLDIGIQLHNLCWDTITVKTWPFGKHKGQVLADIATDYYQWAITNLDALNETSASYDKDLAESVAKELEKRII
jgi:DNA polymerase III epsilon subunit-like protein